MEKIIKTLDLNFNNLNARDQYERRLKAMAAVAQRHGDAARDTIKLWYDWEAMTPGWIIRAADAFLWSNQR